MKKLAFFSLVTIFLTFQQPAFIEAVCEPQHFTYSQTQFPYYLIINGVNNILLNCQPLQTEDEIGAFAVNNGQEFCVGACNAYTNSISFATWQDDSYTPSIKDGFTPGELIRLRIWDASENVEYSATATYETGNGTYGSGLFTEISELNVGGTNTPPEISVNIGFSLLEGAEITISNSMLMGTDSEQGSSELAFTINDPPSQGALKLNDQPTSAFTQADINNSLVSYQHTAEDASDDAFAFVLADPCGESVNGAVSITVRAINTPPTTTGISDVTVAEDSPNTIIDLTAAFDDVEDEDLTYTVQGNTPYLILLILPTAL
ncbi:MAG: hypothetical protein B6244_14370 [Candidatus Cloacimonetes bacterium 4572_55]|nr:MAG: hypothetical protein B6244_14370 [Candidatus Cloacimonetes bacterium 4572_55]